VTNGDHPALVRITQQGTPRSVEQDESQAGYLEVAVMVFVALAAVLLVVWVAISVLDWILGWPSPICFVVTCSPQPQPQPEPQPQPQTQPQLEPQPEPQPQPQPPPQPPRHSARTRLRVRDKVIVGECLPPGYWGYYSRRLRDPPRRWQIECWRDRSIRGPCFE
jgi:hypothetical protein